MFNDLSLVFGPKIPQNLETLPIAFISGIQYNQNNSLSTLKADRYVKENYSTYNTFDITQLLEYTLGVYDYSLTNISLSGSINSISIGGASVSGFQSLGSLNITPNTSNNSGSWLLPTLHSKIEIKGIYISPANTWYPIITPGVCWRLYEVQASEPTGSWIRQSWANMTSGGIASGVIEGNTLLVGYTVPELSYTKDNNKITKGDFPGSSVNYRHIYEQAQVVTPQSIKVNFPIVSVSSLFINNNLYFNGSYDSTSNSSLITKVDYNTGIIYLNTNLATTDNVQVHYYTNADFYIYSGFRDVLNNWYFLDLNPEYGHYTYDSQKSSVRNSGDCLQEEITIYLQPTALLYPKVISSASGSISINYFMDSAFNYGETHFVRHIVRPSVETILSYSNGNYANTFGYAVFGRSYYDESLNISSDVFSTTFPSMMPLGKFVLTAPITKNNVIVADIRQRGGGLPADYNLNAINQIPSGLDTLRNYLDLSIWDGKLVQKYGVVEFILDPSVLNNFTEVQIRDIITNKLPPGIDYVLKFQPV